MQTARPKHHVEAVFYGLVNAKAFLQAMQLALNQVPAEGVFTGDNLVTFSKNLSFLEDERFMAAFDEHAEDTVEKSLIWRIYTLCWAAKRALHLEGDFVECGSYRGTSSRIIVDYLDFAKHDRSFFLYDRFVLGSTSDTNAEGDPDKDRYDDVVTRFAEFDNVHLTKGEVPDVLSQRSPNKIAFLHIDLNNAEAEVSTLNALYDRVVPGGSIVLDDYGWIAYRDQKDAADAFFAPRDLPILELPTGQGLLIK